LVAVVWQFETVPDRGEDFERFYGADGEWTKLSRRSRSCLGSSFLRDLASQTRYMLVEYWSEMVVYEKHLAEFGREVKALEDKRQRLVERVYPLGVFTALDVPERSGPTWSQRS
jgi:quinol monooxygenase YgiN